MISIQAGGISLAWIYWYNKASSILLFNIPGGFYECNIHTGD